MSIIDENIKAINNLKQFDGFKLLSVDGNDLVYNNQRVDISNFSIYELLDGASLFSSALADLTSQEIFDIIRIHAVKINSAGPLKKDDEEKKLEIIKRENPLMRNVTFVTRTANGYTDKYLNVVDSMGIDHLYHVDRNIDVFGLYEQLKTAYGRGNITPEEYIALLDRKIPQVSLESARDMQERSNVTELFQNKVDNLNERYSGDSRVNVYGNEQHDITVIADERGNHQVVTYNTNANGDMIATAHDQNVSMNDAVTMENGQQIESSTDDSSINNSDNNDGYIEKKDKEDSTVELIPFERFKELINNATPWDSFEKQSVELYYGYFGDLIRYEEYLLPELANLLAQFRYFVFELESLRSEGNELNEHQEEVVNKLRELEEKKELVNVDDYNKSMENVQKLVLKMPDNSQREAGSISISNALLVIAIITLILTILTVLFLV
ncbi:MAG: hypothetical protein IKQ29_03225 [Bacilli bacterium]|nr:hypothetical protein [Bacilli bacterium]